MPRMSSLVQMPERSGWPHTVFGAFQFGSFAFAAVVSAGIDRSFDGVRVGPKPRCAIATPEPAPITTSQVMKRVQRRYMNPSPMLQEFYPDRVQAAATLKGPLHLFLMCVLGMVDVRDAEVDHSHQAAVGVIEDVTVKHPCARAIVVAHDQLDGLLQGHVHRVLPFERLDVVALLVEDLEEEAVEMKWMRPLRLVDDGPDLRLPGLRGNRMPFGEWRSVDAVLERAVGTLREGELDIDRRRTRRTERLDC